MTTLYHIEAQTGEYIGSSEARLDPIDQLPMVPAHATLTAPPKQGAAQAAVWNGQTWALTPDHRGAEYWLANGTSHTIDVLGVEPPAGALDAAPTPTLDETKSAAVKALYAACAAAITSGYTSAALGSKHTYPSGTTDQTNMLGSVTDSLLPNLPSDWTTPFWCADDKGVWAMCEHTAAQIQRAGADGKAWVVACQQKLTGLVAQVQASETVADVDAITW